MKTFKQHISESGVKTAAAVGTTVDGKSVEDSQIGAFNVQDILLNAAGGNMPGATIAVDQTIFDLSMDDFKKVTELNLNGSVIPSLIFGKIMADQKSGAIINYSSMSVDILFCCIQTRNSLPAALMESELTGQSRCGRVSAN